MSSFPPPESNPPQAPVQPPAYGLQPPAFQPDAAAQQAAQAQQLAAQQAAYAQQLAAQQAAQQPAQPQYGELAPPQYGERIPHYGEPAASPAPQSYPQAQAQQQPYPQAAYQQAYPAAPGHSPFDLYPPEAPKSPRLGQVAMYAAIGIFVLSVIASIVVGTTAGPLSTRTSTGLDFNTGNMTPYQAAGFAGVGALILVQMLLGTAIGLWALVQGIVAAATKRGRSFGVVAIIVAAAAPIVSFIAYMVSIVATLPPA